MKTGKLSVNKVSMSRYKVLRGDYRSDKEFRKARKAWKKFRAKRLLDIKAQKKRAFEQAKRKPTQKEAWKHKYKEYLNSERWQVIKDHIHLVRDGRCERCGFDETLQVHHKHYRNVFKERMEDLELLCRKCHRAEYNIE